MKTRFTKTATERQTALDYIIAHPNAYGPEIVAAIGWHKSVGADRLRDMADHGEIERTPAVMKIVNAKGHKAEVRTNTYIALVTKARTAEEVISNLATNLGNTKAKCPERYKAATVRDPNRKPIPGQRGQGAVRHSVQRGCSLS